MMIKLEKDTLLRGSGIKYLGRINKIKKAKNNTQYNVKNINN